MYLRILAVPIVVLAFAACGSSDKPAGPKVKTGPMRAYNVPASRQANDAARFLAGLPGLDGSTYAQFESNPAWVGHAAKSDAAWKRFESVRHLTLKQFQTSLPANLPAERLFYPFGGADVITSDSFFPKTSLAVFVGLEPPGSLPTPAQIGTAQLDKFLPNLRQTLSSLMTISFFKTREMESQVRGQITDGLLPLFLIQVARLGYDVNGWAPVTLTDEGRLVERLSDSPGPMGVVFEYQAKGGDPRQIAYFGYDLSDKNLKTDRALLKLMDSKKPFQTFFKSASYLPHLGDFTEIRNFAITESAAILQDDTGVPFHYLKGGQFDVTLYGAYAQPIPLFWRRVQSDLRSEYRVKPGVKPLPFDIGYGFGRQRSNLLLAVRDPRKQIPPSELVPKPGTQKSDRGTVE